MQYALLAPSLFLSYSHADATVAGAFVRELQARGANVWLDREQIRPGEDWAAQIEDAIRRVDVFLLLVTPASEESEWVERELSFALATRNRTKVVPIRIGGAKMPTSVGHIQWLEANANDLATAAERILQVTRDPRVRGSVILDEVERSLDNLGLEWQREPTVAGVRPDFLVHLGRGRLLVIEVKSRANPSVVEAISARTRAERMRELTGAEAALVVFPQLNVAPPTDGVIELNTLGRSIRAVLLSDASGVSTKRQIEAVPQDGSRTIFAAMPFAGEYDDVYWVAMTAAAQAVGAACLRVDKEEYEGDIAAKIRDLIKHADALVADLSESNPNVLYEVGYAHALSRPCVPICSTPLDDLPLDVRNFNTLAYDKGRTWALREPLTARLRAALDE